MSLPSSVRSTRFLNPLLVILVLLCVVQSCRNPETPNPPYFRTLNRTKLAHRLTRYCLTDSQKVYAIHHWITHHIKYDVKRYYSYGVGAQPVSLRRVLRKRKGICGDYSELFGSLCKSAGIESMVVTGYAKSNYYDVGNPFYMEDHAWNAVKVGDQWLLVDATWDAGQIKLFKRSLKGRILRFFTFGRQDQMVYKPHFVKRPTTKYYLRNGVFMKTDHIASVPLWQIQTPPISLKEAETDSAIHYNYFLLDVESKDTLTRQRSAYAKLDDVERHILSGKQAFEYNHRNHYAAGYSFELQAAHKANEVKPGKDSARFFTDANMGQYLLKKAIMHYDSNQIMLNRQNATRMEQLDDKKQILKKENNGLMSETKVSANLLTNGEKNARTGKSYLDKLVPLGNSQFGKVAAGKRFNSSTRSRIPRPEDSTKTLRRIQFLMDSTRKVHEVLMNQLILVGQLSETAFRQMAEYSNHSTDYTKTTKNLADLRILGLDDYDPTLRILKNSLIRQKKVTDKNLEDGKGKMVVAAWLEEIRKLKGMYDALFKVYNTIESECGNLKRICMQPTTALELRLQSVQAYKADLKKADAKVAQLKAESEKLKVACADHRKTALNEYARYKHEMSTGFYMYSIAGKHFQNQYKQWKMLNQTRKKESGTALAELNKSFAQFEKMKTSGR